MLCNPKKCAAIALKLSIVVSLEIGHDFYSLTAANIRSSSGAVRNAEPKHNLVRLALEHVIRQIVEDRHGTHRPGSNTIDSVYCRACHTIVELRHQKVDVIAPSFQNLIVLRVSP